LLNQGKLHHKHRSILILDEGFDDKASSHAAYSCPVCIFRRHGDCDPVVCLLEDHLDWHQRAEGDSREQRSLPSSAVRQKEDSHGEPRHEGATATQLASKTSGVQDYSKAIGGVALGLFFSFALMMWSVSIGRFCYDLDLLVNHEPFFHLRIIGVILALCTAFSGMVLTLRSHTYLKKGILLGLSVDASIGRCSCSVFIS
jgi:hypothetical protein